VILFVALSYAVTQSMSSGGQPITIEKADTMAARLIQFGTLVENAVIRARIGGDVQEWGLDFSPLMSENNTCNESKCRIFTTPAREGQITLLTFENSYVDPRVGSSSPAKISVRVLRVANVGTTLPELVLFVHSLRTEICQAVNQSLLGQRANPHQGYTSTAYSGTLAAFPDDPGTINQPLFVGQRAGCIGRENASPANGGIFYQVLIAR